MENKLSEIEETLEFYVTWAIGDMYWDLDQLERTNKELNEALSNLTLSERNEFKTKNKELLDAISQFKKEINKCLEII